MTRNGSWYPCSRCGAYNAVSRTHCGTCRRPLK